MYDFTLETYSTLSRACYNCPNNYTDCLREDCIPGDGIVKTIETVNRQFPGPYIQVCHGDSIVVKVHNKLRSQRVATIHWHGLTQFNNSQMDGVGMINQWPILPYTSFEYKFKADSPGSHFWHAHTGILRTDAIFGPLIIREKSDPNRKLYDFDLKEHYLILNEWHKNQLISIYGPYLHNAYFGMEYSILINGKAGFSHLSNLSVPLTTFKVKQGFRYRFRLINAAAENCYMQISIDKHKLKIIAADGHPVDPIDIDSISLLAGERYDFVIEANNSKSDYWIKVKGEGNCAFNRLFQRAILRYEDSTNILDSKLPFSYEDAESNGTAFRSNIDSAVNVKTYTHLKTVNNYSLEFLDRISSKADRVVYLNFDLKPFDDPEVHNPELYSFNKSVNNWYSSFINEIKFEMPHKPALLFPSELNNLCNETNLPCTNRSSFCACTHYLEFNLDELIEMVLIDGNGFFEKHSVYLHGHDFAVIGTGLLKEKGTGYLTNDEVRRQDQQGYLNRNFDRPVIKDTVTISRGGYTIIRFIANNPGFWLLHCHIDSHSDPGMTILIKVNNKQNTKETINNDFIQNFIYLLKQIILEFFNI